MACVSQVPRCHTNACSTVGSARAHRTGIGRKGGQHAARRGTDGARHAVLSDRECVEQAAEPGSFACRRSLDGGACGPSWILTQTCCRDEHPATLALGLNVPFVLVGTAGRARVAGRGVGLHLAVAIQFAAPGDPRRLLHPARETVRRLVARRLGASQGCAQTALTSRRPSRATRSRGCRVYNASPFASATAAMSKSSARAPRGLRPAAATAPYTRA